MLASTLKLIRDGLLAVAYPQRCRVCGAMVESWDDGVSCFQCWEDESTTLLFGGRQICARCGLPRSAIAGATGETCRSCIAPVCGPPRSCGVYAGALEANVLFLKRHPHVCPRLRKLIESVVDDWEDAAAFDVVLPVPLHPKRRKARGFNQAELIAAIVAAHAGVALDLESLVRIRHTKMHRTGMDAAERAKSLAGSFAVARRRAIDRGAVLLVDDVFTTGSTVAEAGRVLLEAGAASVMTFTLARAVDLATLTRLTGRPTRYPKLG